MAEVIAMCGRYSLTPADSAEIEKIVRRVKDRIRTREIYLTNTVPVLMEAAGELVPREDELERWVTVADTATEHLGRTPPALVYKEA